MSIELHPVENMALAVARVQVERGDEPTPNIAATCVMTLARLVDGKSFGEAYGLPVAEDPFGAGATP